MEESNEMALATFKVLTSKWEKFKAISKSKGKTASFILNEFIDQTIAAEENLPTKPSPDKFITQENLVTEIAPLVARIDALEKWINSAPEISIGKFREVAIATEPVTDPNPGQNTPDPTPPVNESPKSCFDLVGTVSEVVEVPAPKEQIPEIPEQKPDISDTTISEVPDTIPEPTEFSQKTIDEVLNARPPVPDEIIYDHEGVDVTDPEMKRFFAGQLTHWTTVAESLGFPRQHFESASASEKFQKEVETVICLDENLYLWIGETKTPVEETDD
jgi:hypothetical protein